MSPTPQLICAGEAVMDLIPDGPLYRPVPGGAALNSARAAARLGVSVAFFGAVSRDRLGEQLAEAARDDGVDMAHALRTDAPTPVSLVQLKDGDARFSIHHRDTAHDRIVPGSLPDVPNAQALLIGGFSLVHAPAAETFERLAEGRPPGTLLYLDLNIRPSLITDPDAYRTRLMRLIAAADIVKASDEDLAWLGPDLVTASSETLLLHTQAETGATAVLGGTEISVDAPKVAVVDTVGAGDVFNAAWLAFGLRCGQVIPQAPPDIEAALRFAVRAASLSTQTAGARGPTMEEMTCAP